MLKLEFVFVLPFRDNSSFGLNSLGLLCLWQCFTHTLNIIPHNVNALTVSLTVAVIKLLSSPDLQLNKKIAPLDILRIPKSSRCHSIWRNGNIVQQKWSFSI